MAPHTKLLTVSRTKASAEVCTDDGKLYLSVAVDRTSNFAAAKLYIKPTQPTVCQFWDELSKVVPYRIHTLLTDNGIQFADQPHNRNTAYSRQSRFDMICEANGIEHRLTKPNHAWSEDDQPTTWGTVGPANEQGPSG